VLKLYSDIQASQFSYKKDKYINKFLGLLNKIYQNYELLITDKIKISKKENEIRNILVDNYLSKNIDNYTFKKEEQNNLGRVDIFIQKDFTEDTPEFIIECKILDNKNLEGTEGLNAKYIKNGIQRFLTEHYFSYNDFYVNAMIGFVVEKIDIEKNIHNLNNLSKKLLNNLVKITQQIEPIDTNIYQSQYLTINNKEFIVYHQMTDFSNNIIVTKD
jgi:hypothetical protein